MPEAVDHRLFNLPEAAPVASMIEVNAWSQSVQKTIEAALLRYQLEAERLGGQPNVTIEEGTCFADEDDSVIELGGYNKVVRYWGPNGEVHEMTEEDHLPFASGTNVRVLGFGYQEAYESGVTSIEDLIESGRAKATVLPRLSSDNFDCYGFNPILKLTEKTDLPLDRLVLVAPEKAQRVAVKRRLDLVDLASSDVEKQSPTLQYFLRGEFAPALLDKSIETPGNLDEFQSAVYQRAMDIDNNPMVLLHGPPGSGKSTTTTEIVKGHLKAKRKVLLLSHSNKGAQVPALMLQKAMHRQTAINRTHVAGNNAAVIDPQLQPCRIKKSLPQFPDAELTAIKALSYDQIESYMLGKGLIDKLEAPGKARSPEEVFEQRYGYSVKKYCEVYGYDFDEFDVSDAIEEAFEDQEAAERVNPKEVIRFKQLLIDNALKPYRDAMNTAAQKLEKDLEKGGLVVSTFGTAINDEILDAIDFDVVVVDEATRMEMPDTIYALQKAGAQIMFVGDPLQLGNLPPEPGERETLIEKLVAPIRNSQQQITREIAVATGAQVDSAWQSPFADLVLSTQNPAETLPYHLLQYNRRSKPSIVKVLSELIYDCKMMVDESSVEAGEEGVVKWFDTANLENARERTRGTSKQNSAEADLIADKVVKMLLSGQYSPEDIGVISTYKMQSDLILKRLKRRMQFGNDHRLRRWYSQIEEQGSINTVDAFQGDERKVIMVSMTRSNDEGEVGFLEEQRRIGVAIGRAQDKLYIYGDSKTLTAGEDEASIFFQKLSGLIAENGEKEEIEPEALLNTRIGAKRRKIKNA